MRARNQAKKSGPWFLGLALSCSVLAEDICELSETKNIDQLYEDVSKIYPTKYAGSCAVRTEMSKNANWREEFGDTVDRFIKNTSQKDDVFQAIKGLSIYEIEMSKQLRKEVEEARNNRVDWYAFLKNKSRSARSEYEDQYKEVVQKDLEAQTNLNRFKDNVIYPKMKKSVIEKMKTPQFRQNILALAEKKEMYR